MGAAKQNLKVQKLVAVLALLLFFVKMVAWYLTQSVSILTDALESIVNVVAGFIGLYSLYIAAKPRDSDHPYGHGKAEFVSAAVEGTLISVASLFIVYEAVMHLIYPQPVQQLDYGILLVAITAVLNFAMGYFVVRIGRRNNSLSLVASGRHLKTDTYSTIGIIAGLGLLYYTNIWWIDSTVAILFAVFIMVTGYKIIRSSLAGIMDEADEKLIKTIVEKLNAHRRANWVDLHNFRIIKYGATLHFDCHLTVPWYFNVLEAHAEVEYLSSLLQEDFGEGVEFFVHNDGCTYAACPLCMKEDCPVRKHPFVARVEWTAENILANSQHTTNDAAET